MNSITTKCVDCGQNFQRPIQKGRPAIRCLSCRNAKAGKVVVENKPVETHTAKRVSSDFHYSEKMTDEEEFIGSEKEENQQIEEDVVKEETKQEINWDDWMKTQSFPFYQVVITNGVGVKFQGQSEKEARKVFKLYSEKSNLMYGQVGGERVSLLLHHSAEQLPETIASFSPLQEEVSP